MQIIFAHLREENFFLHKIFLIDSICRYYLVSFIALLELLNLIFDYLRGGPASHLVYFEKQIESELLKEIPLFQSSNHVSATFL